MDYRLIDNTGGMWYNLGTKSVNLNRRSVMNGERQRPQLTIGEVMRFLSKYPEDMPVLCAISEVNLDEPVETQEFILEEEAKTCVAMATDGKTMVFGYVDE
jgi:hypothetical protein